MVFDLEVELGEELGPSSLLYIQSLSYHKILKGLVISQHLELFFSLESFQLCSPLLECLDNGQHFFIIDLIVLLSIRYSLGVEYNRILVLFILLSEYSCYHSIRSISFELSLKFRLIIIEYRYIY